nr:hypothetical protein [Tanacetum cinerariifolium]
AKLRTQLYKKVSDQKDNTQDMSKKILPKIGKTNALSKPVTSNSVFKPPVSKGMNNDKVIAPGMFRISPYKVSREAKKVPNTVCARSRAKPITVSQPSVITKKGMNSNLNGLSSTGLDNTKTRRPQPRSNTKNDRVPSASKSSRSMNKEVKIDNAFVYDSDGSAEVHENCDDNEIFNMFTQEEHYTKLLEPILESHQVPQNDNDVISEDTSVEQGGETVEQHPVNFEETRTLYESLYQNLAIEVKKVNSVNHKLKETNADLTTELARFKNQTRCFEISQEKYDTLERCYQQSVYQEQCLSKKINALHLSTAKFVGDFKSLANEADASLAKHKALELEIKRLLKAIVSQDIMIIVQNKSVGDTSDLQTYKDMQQKIKRLQAQLGDLKGKSKDTSCVSDTRNPLSQKLENENVELEFQDNTQDTSENTKFAKQPIMENLPKVGETNALSKPVTSNSVSTPQESKGVNNDKVITPGMFRSNPFKTSWEEKHVPNTVSASARTKPITVSQPHVITKKDVNSDLNGLSSTGVDNTKTRRP